MRADALFAQASEAYLAGNMETAQDICHRILNSQSDHAGAYHLLALVSLHAARPDKALQLLEKAVELSPRHAGIRRTAGDAYSSHGSWPDAIREYQRALDIDGNDVETLIRLAKAHRAIDDFKNAIHFYRRAVALDPKNPEIHNSIGLVFNAHGEPEASIEAYQQAVKLDPLNPDYRANLATLYEQTNQLDKAEEAATAGLALSPDHDTLSLVLAKCLRRKKDYPNAIKILDSASKNAVTPPIQRAFEFEYGRNLDCTRQYDAAFKHFARGNELARSIWPGIDLAGNHYRASLALLRDTYSSDWVASWTRGYKSSDDISPIFLVGFPRSGTTLLDTILGAHPDITILEERPTLDPIIAEVSRLPGGYPQALASLDPGQIDKFRAMYSNAIKLITGKSLEEFVVIDKQPLITAHAGLIARLFPGTRFIYALRHPCDICLSCFMQEFGPHPAYASFLDIEQTALCYAEMAELWSTYVHRLQLRTCTFRYEDLIQNGHSAIQGLMQFIGLEWSEDMDDHTAHARRRGRIYTPSYHQVIRPLYANAMFRWKHYESHFGKALETLAPYVSAAGYRQ